MYPCAGPPCRCPLDTLPEAPPARSLARFVGVRFGICVKYGAECTPDELWGLLVRSFLGLRSSSFAHLKQFSVTEL
eukprot:838980-Alexandrium_andersonii.AAC.1